MNISRTQTDKLLVGTNDVSYVPPDTSPTGTAVMNGPVYIGKTSASPGYEAFLNVTSNPSSQLPLDTQPKAKADLSIKSDGNVTIEGDGKTSHGLDVSGGASIDVLRVRGDAYFDGKVDCGNKGRLASRFAAADASPKPFDLEHPTKGKGHRLRYACIEGPEVAVYYRGRLKGSNKIMLPYYWKDLVHEESITVQLQPIGDRHFHLNVVSFTNEWILVKEADDKPIDCFYHVYGERKDINPLITEYEGDSWEDYPDPNYDPNKVDSEEKNTKDPRFDGPPNTITK